ncbi:unnamed protein product [Meganyctiphanes norvegica]|uniref:F-box domain-containing protein n=1 Tax=Meganyctiphanes norvegica TaxID=48144 RepID=A0AAV2RL86_MEGNR
MLRPRRIVTKKAPPDWLMLPDSLLLHIFTYLEIPDIAKVTVVCRSWLRVAHDEFLWRFFFYKDFQVDKSVPIMPGRSSWYLEYKRLVEGTPCVQTEEIGEHTHQVLHVSFSHRGHLFATSSKDGYIIVWNSTYPAEIKYFKDMKVHSWKYTQFSQFNSSDTLLLVSGVHFGSQSSTSGEIAVFNIENDFQLQCRVLNKPYDIFGTWYNDQYLLSGDLHWLAHLVSTSVIWLNKAKQETSSEHHAIISRLHKFYNRNASSVRTILVANCLSQEIPSKNTKRQFHSQEEIEVKEQRGNPVSRSELRVGQNSINPEEAASMFQAAPENEIYTNTTSINYTSEYREAEKSPSSSLPLNSAQKLLKEDKIAQSRSTSMESLNSLIDEPMDVASKKTINRAPDWEEGEISPPMSLAEDRDKYLIFTTGSKTYSPHQIGFKRINNFEIPTVVEQGPGLRERMMQREQLREMRNMGLFQEPNWLDFEAVADRFDTIDHLIDLNGHIIGMGLSPDHRYLYVNSRPWPSNYTIESPLSPPRIAQAIDMHVIDLTNLKEVGTMLNSHKAYTPNDDCFFIFLDVSHEYVASGAEDKHGYVWERHYGVSLAKLPHKDVVNAVAFNPADPEMLVTVSDDHKIKIWRSRRRARELGIDEHEVGIAKEMRFKCSSPENDVTV